MANVRSQPTVRRDGRISSRTLGGVALIVVAATVAYLPSLGGDFILDDRLNLIENELIRADDGPYRFWLTTQPIDYWPVFNTALWLEWRLWGANPIGYHVTNLALHIGSVLLVWVVLARLSIPGAFLAAALFAVHPVNVESVAWITQLKNLLALFFSLASVLFYLNAERQRGRHSADSRGPNLWYAGSLGTFALAMLSKGSVAVVPVLLLGILGWSRRIARGDLVRLAPFFAISAALVPINMWFQARLETQIPATGLVERLLTAPAVVWFYLLKALVPVDLAFVYPRWQVSATEMAWWLPLLAAVAATVLLWRHRRSWGRPLLFAWGYFWVSLAPVLGFTDIGFMEHSLVADHYQHLALIGIMALLAAGWSAWQAPTLGAARWAANGVAVTAVATLALLTWEQSSLYTDAGTLYRDTLEKNPGSSMTHNNLGALLTDLGRHEEAIDHLRQALRLKPNYADAHNNLGNALRRSGRLQDAIEHYGRATQLKPTFPNAHYNLGIALAEAGEPAAAIGRYREALRLQPTHLHARLNLGNLLADLGQLEEAIEEYQAALQFAPNFAEAYHNLGAALTKAGRPAEAIDQYEQALRLMPDSPRVHYNLGIALISEQPSKAIAHLREAVRLQPDHALAHNDLGVALVGAGQVSEAVGHFQEALRLQPDLADARYNLELTRSRKLESTHLLETDRDGTQ